ncbi:MAG: protein-glutamate O-methyltransferase CheR [Defluviitaleaceae bacterium]|nr:protein-glutamate O-methyltransferase CheR [Defluviitaleaceae bacterium]
MKDLTDKEFYMLRDYIKANFGINLGIEKKSLIYSRLRSTLVEKGFADFTQYYNYLVNDKSGMSVVTFIDKITTNHTFFMRETDHFSYLRETALPETEQIFGRERDLRLWCAGCSSGEEAYTIKIIVEEYFKGKGWNTDILATDISTTVLTKALNGQYLKENMGNMPPDWLKKYFVPQGENYAVCDDIKKGIIFRKFNLMNPSFTFKKKFHIVFCRNVMIYFDLNTRQELVEKFYNATEDGGYFFIGHSESLSNTKTNYKYIMPAVYRKESGG